MSEPVLEQRQIDLLIRGIREGRVKTGRKSLARIHHAVAIDLTDPAWSQERIVRRKLPVLDLVFDRFCPAVQVTMTKTLRFPIRAEASRVEIMKFGDVRRRFDGQPAVFEIMRMDPLRGYHVMVFDSALLYALIDAMMGGLGVGEMPFDREVSEIELSLLQRAHSEMLRDFENAWRPWFPLQVEHVRAERNVQVSSTLSDDEICHVATITAAGDVLPTSPIHFVMPYTSLEPLLETTSATGGDETDPNWRLNLERNLGDASASVSAVLGRAMVPGARLYNMQPGDVFELERRVDEDIDVLVEDEPIFRGRVGRSGTQYGVKITRRREAQRTVTGRSAGQTLVRKGLLSREQLRVAMIDERLNKRPMIESIVARGWIERRIVERALQE